MSVALETTGLGKRYGRLWALQDCTLALPVGRVAALVGPNGAGKTTLLHLIAGLAQPDAGEVLVLGETPGDNTRLLARVGFVAQETPLYPDFTAADLVTMGGKLNRRWDADMARARLARLGIPLDRPTGRLSGGQRAQVALALALAKRPDLLLLDEPVASLDPLARREFLQALMGAVADDGTTVLLSSHLVFDLERVCDYLIVLHTARVQVLGAVEELLAHHKILVGPRRPVGPIGGVAAVVRESHTGKQTTLLVRTAGPIHDPVWTVDDVSLEDLVLAYLANPEAGALPGPERLEAAVSSMTWLTWRQHRAQAAYAAAGLAILAVVMVASGLAMFNSLTELGLDGCGPLSNSLDSCDNAAGAFFDRFALLQQVATLLLLLPLLLGLFFGAPLVARELEQGTHRLVWTQGVTRRRWFVVKAGLVLAATTAFMGAYSALLYWWYTPLSRAGASRFAYLEFDVQGIAPIGYAIFAVALGIAAGTLWRKVLPAMGVTLAGFLIGARRGRVSPAVLPAGSGTPHPGLQRHLSRAPPRRRIPAQQRHLQLGRCVLQ